MKPLRLSALLIFAGLLVACDDPPAPKAPPTPQPPAVQPATPAPSKAEAPERPQVDEQAVRVAGDEKPAAEEKKPAVATAPKPKPSKPKPAKDVVLPPAKLDLRLPKELVEEIQPSEVLNEQPVLPPMFVDKTPDASPFELNGRILTNEQAGDDSVQGAELQFKFRN